VIMSRSLPVLTVAALIVTLPAQAQQSSRSLELGITGGVSHHDFHYRYPGEGRWEDALGLRLDARLLLRDRSAIGVAIVADRYVYSVASGICLSTCVPAATAPDHSGSGVVPVATAWQVSRVGLGATWQQQLFGPIHGNLGVLAGRSWRETLDDAPATGPLPTTTREWFAGGEAGMTVHWRDLAFGVGGEYGRVPRTDHALRPYYGRIVGRVAYRTSW
jgi:hypothetical protein